MSQRLGFGLIGQLTLCLAVACGGEKATSPTAPTTPVPPSTGGGSATAPPVYVVMFTHIEDNTPGGTLGSAGNRSTYLTLRGRLIAMADLARRYNVPWVLQPDWKFPQGRLLAPACRRVPTTSRPPRSARQVRWQPWNATS
jgi:hypothetical protein